jgi:hypothetical protein
MKYATWKLNFSNLEYGTGPEYAIAKQGVQAEGGWVNGEVENGATILGYLTDAVDESKLTSWQVENLSEAEALDFALAINPEAYLLPDGRITAPMEMPND